jgi:hypothetical protein
MTPQDIVSVSTAVGAGILALIPVYQKWKEIRRAELLADHEKGIDTIKETFKQTFDDKNSIFIMALCLLILGGMAHNVYRAGRIEIIADAHYQEFKNIKDIINTRYGETMTQRKEILDAIERIDKSLDKIEKKKSHE